MSNEINIRLVFDFNQEKFTEEVFVKPELITFLNFLTKGQTGVYQGKRNNYKCDGKFFTLVSANSKEYELNITACIAAIEKAIIDNK